MYVFLIVLTDISDIGVDINVLISNGVISLRTIVELWSTSANPVGWSCPSHCNWLGTCWFTTRSVIMIIINIIILFFLFLSHTWWCLSVGKDWQSSTKEKKDNLGVHNSSMNVLLGDSSPFIVSLFPLSPNKSRLQKINEKKTIQTNTRQASRASKIFHSFRVFVVVGWLKWKKCFLVINHFFTKQNKRKLIELKGSPEKKKSSERKKK